jgi:hypothetical protein
VRADAQRKKNQMVRPIPSRSHANGGNNRYTAAFNPMAIQFNIETIHHANAAITTSAISTNGAKYAQPTFDFGFVMRRAARLTVISLFLRHFLVATSMRPRVYA